METYIVKVPVTGKVEVVPFNAADSYEQIHDAVGGYIEAAAIPTISTKEDYTIDCFVDEEGLVKNPPLPCNLRLSIWANQRLVGNAVFVAHDDQGETVGLSKEDADTILWTISIRSMHIGIARLPINLAHVGEDMSHPTACSRGSAV